MKKGNTVKPVGRPSKKGAKKSGDLNDEECYFTFISNKYTISNIKKDAKEKGISIKALMSNILALYNPKTKNEERIMRFVLKNNPSD